MFESQSLAVHLQTQPHEPAGYSRAPPWHEKAVFNCLLGACTLICCCLQVQLEVCKNLTGLCHPELNACSCSVGRASEPASSNEAHP